jgi:sugar lactone lactonase YvrE
MPSDVKVSPGGRIFFTEWEGDRILELNDDGTISTFIELKPQVNSILINSASELFVLQCEEILKILPTRETIVFAKLSPGQGIGGWTMDSHDNLYAVIGDQESHDLVRFAPDGRRTTIASGACLPAGLKRFWLFRSILPVNRQRGRAPPEPAFPHFDAPS